MVADNDNSAEAAHSSPDATKPTSDTAHSLPPQDSSSSLNDSGAAADSNRIPKKSLNGSHASTSDDTDDESKNDATDTPQPEEKHSNSADCTLDLPVGVILPPSVTPPLIASNGRLKHIFFSLSPSQMNEALMEYEEAVKEKGNEIRNKQAYLFGVVKRYKMLHERSMGEAKVLPQGDRLSSHVTARLDSLVQSGFCTRDELDTKVKSKMRMLPERDALDAIDEMNSVPRQESEYLVIFCLSLIPFVSNQVVLLCSSTQFWELFHGYSKPIHEGRKTSTSEQKQQLHPS